MSGPTDVVKRDDQTSRANLALPRNSMASLSGTAAGQTFGRNASLTPMAPLYKAGRLFFFHAEDGIRDSPKSRGLGDGYKRQRLADGPGLTFRLALEILAILALARKRSPQGLRVTEVADMLHIEHRHAQQALDALHELNWIGKRSPVSYTQLTLPKNREVMNYE